MLGAAGGAGDVCRRDVDERSAAAHLVKTDRPRQVRTERFIDRWIEGDSCSSVNNEIDIFGYRWGTAAECTRDRSQFRGRQLPQCFGAETFARRTERGARQQSVGTRLGVPADQDVDTIDRYV